MRLLSWAATDTGRKRDHNEDSFLVDDQLHLYAVADGMGGHQGGGFASRLALEVVKREIGAIEGDFDAAAARLSRKPQFDLPVDPMGHTIEEDDVLGDTIAPSDDEPKPIRDTTTEPTADLQRPVEVVMNRAARQACSEIFDTAQLDPGLQGMGTTLSACCFVDDVMHFAHAGDSRIYLFRDDNLRQVTEDHSWIWEQIKAGIMTEEQAKSSQFRHIITRSVGFEREVEVDTGGISVHAGDCYLLCSDGMSNYVELQELEAVLRSTWYRRAPELLIELANDRGGDDNITVVVIYAANDDS